MESATLAPASPPASGVMPTPLSALVSGSPGPLDTEPRFEAHVLFVDDDPEFLALIPRLMTEFSSSRWEVFVAADVPRALVLLDRHPMDLVVIDVHLPKANGIELLALLQSHRRAGARAVLTADPNAEHRRACLDLGADLFLEKPRQVGGWRSVYACLQALIQHGRTRSADPSPKVAVPAPAREPGEQEWANRSTDEVVVWSATDGVLHEWRSPNVRARADLLASLAVKSRLAAQALGLGRFDRLETHSGPHRLVVKMGLRQALLARSHRLCPTEGALGTREVPPLAPEPGLASSDGPMHEVLSDWLSRQGRPAGVLAWGLRYPDNTSFTQSFVPGLGAQALEQVCGWAADTGLVLQLNRLPTDHMHWVYEKVSLYCARRRDAIYLIVVAVRVLPPNQAEQVAGLLARFRGAEAAPADTAVGPSA